MTTGDPPPAPRIPARKALLLVGLGMAAAILGIAFGARELLSPKEAQGYGKTGASLAMGGMIMAGIGAPALKRQSLAREQLAAFAARRGLTISGPDEATGTLDGLPLTVRIAYGHGPYRSRGASEILVHLRVVEGKPITLLESEPFDDAEVVGKHLDRLTDRALRRARPDAA